MIAKFFLFASILFRSFTIHISTMLPPGHGNFEKATDEAFRNSVLTPPLVHFNEPGGHDAPDTRDAFIREYTWLEDLLKRQYPDNEFMILPVSYEITPPGGWIWVPFGWGGHLIYRRPINRSA